MILEMAASAIISIGGAPTHGASETAWFVAMLVWTIAVGGLDNILRPILIRKGADLPLLLIFAGVVGGLFAFGLLGLFVGPVLLAVAYTLLDSWVSETPDAEVVRKQVPE